MPSSRLGTAVAALSAFSLIPLLACGPAKSSGGAQAQATDCVSCHGSPDNSAPPFSTHGAQATSDIAVGAHQAHLHPGPFRKAVACDECHAVPETVGAPGHDDGRVDMLFGGLASAGGASPTWTRSTATCSATYCHGGSLAAGGAVTAPLWNKVDGSQVTCGTCHGVPPPTSTGHPQVTGGLAACASCHPGTMKADGTLDIQGGQHIDGVVEVGAAACVACHGDKTGLRLPASIASAPPGDARVPQNTATTAVGVGAHQVHLTGTSLRRDPIVCTDCHTVPDRVAGHPSGTIDMTWGPLAKAGGAAPVWSHSTATCSATYCHGATLTGGTVSAPVWTQVDGVQVRCGACHGVPPPAPHVQDAACGGCHTGYTATTVDPAKHIDGYVELGVLSCTSCHGDANRGSPLQAAPPTAVNGATDPSSPGVGAHMAHLTGSTWRAPIECAECHAPVTTTDHSAGKNLVVSIDWGPIASADGSYPVWDAKALTCSSTYCHGGTLTGGAVIAPVWNKVDGTQAACGACHGVPPPAPHVARNDCGTCHPGFTSTIVNKATHINGVLDAITLRCTTCHGDATRPVAVNQPAPPADTKGNLTPTSVGVGAHDKHLKDGVLRKAVACGECHPVPTVANHADGVVDVVWGALARAGGTSPSWSRSTATCSATYCHGATLGGGTGKAPLWTKVDGSQTACGNCHGVPPPAPHVQDRNCAGCHTGYTATTVNVAVHMNGVVDAAGSCTSCHGDAARLPAALASAPPRDATGNTVTAAPGVGAHLAHLTAPRGLGPPVACTECHVVPADMTSHPSGTLDLSFGPLARTGGATPVWSPSALTCSATYCHGGGAVLTGGNLAAPIWNKVDGTQVACGACHGVPPPAPHDPSSACGTCHAGYTSTTVVAATHMNGVVEVTGGSCTSCHGDAARTPAAIAPAPPLDVAGLSATSRRGVGAHLAHLAAGPRSAGFACSECHPVPATAGVVGAHRDGVTEVTFGPLSRGSGAAPIWSTSTLTCSANYCHGATLPNAASATAPNGTNHAPVWTTVNGTQAACGTCHGVPPPAPHVQNTACGSCHTGYTSTTVNLATHVDGQVQAAGMTCTSCHGDAGRVLLAGADAQTKSSPPVDTRGGAAVNQKGVGAHVAHLNRGALGALVKCSECHPVPSSMTHSNGKVEVAFGTLSKTRGVSPVYTASTATCSATYCHGAGLTGGSKPNPTFTQVGGLTCTTCHAEPPNDRCHPPQFNHSGGNRCNSCHKDTDAGGTTIVNAKLHINGVVDGKCADCHRGQTCTP